MEESSTDPDSAYINGINKLLEIIDRRHTNYLDVLVFQQRLIENISRTRLYGDTETRLAERAEIIHHLNQIALSVIGVSFNELCDYAISKYQPVKQQPQADSKTTQVSLPPGAWIHLEEVSKIYAKGVKAISLLTDIKEYEYASSLYWKTLYYSGYRELWEDRDHLSRKIFNLSLQVKDYKTAGLILAKGMAYALMSQRKYSDAEYFLKKALVCFEKAHAHQEEWIYYDYMADIYGEIGHIDKAITYYQEARKRTNNIDEYQVYLKQLFLTAKHDPNGSKSQLVALTLLRDQFSSIKNYKEGLVEIEIAKTLYILRDVDEALAAAKRGYHLLNNVIIMPRNAKKAKNMLDFITEKKPVNLAK